MKKLFILVAVMISALSASAQVVFETTSFGDVLKKAQSENKLIFVDCYTSWCGPCKILANTIFPTKEVGDYMNAKFINFKIDMEKGEGVHLRKKYNITVFPTLLILNSDGTEFNRSVGAETEVQKFIEKIESISDSKNNIAVGREKFKRSLEGANEFIQVLNDNYLLEERDLALVSVYNRRSNAENFKQENFKLYKSLITTIYHPVALSIMSSGNEAIKFLGKKEYADFVKDKVDATLVNMAMSNQINSEKIAELITMSKKYKEMRTPLLSYYSKIGNYIDDKNCEAIIDCSTKSFKALSQDDRTNMVRFTHRMAVTSGNIEKLIPFYEFCIKSTTDEKESKKYAGSLELVKTLILKK